MSPLLPAIEKVLGKANMDYESKAQKEHQDFLDSIADLIDFDGLRILRAQIPKLTQWICKIRIVFMENN